MCRCGTQKFTLNNIYAASSLGFFKTHFSDGSFIIENFYIEEYFSFHTLMTTQNIAKLT